MKLSIIGSGYVGLVTGTCLAEAGHTVLCVDNKQAKVTELQAGRLNNRDTSPHTFYRSGCVEIKGLIGLPAFGVRHLGGSSLNTLPVDGVGVAG